MVQSLGLRVLGPEFSQRNDYLIYLNSGGVCNDDAQVGMWVGDPGSIQLLSIY